MHHMLMMEDSRYYRKRWILQKRLELKSSGDHGETQNVLEDVAEQCIMHTGISGESSWRPQSPGLSPLILFLRKRRVRLKLKESSVRNPLSKSLVFSYGLTKEFLGTHSSVVQFGLYILESWILYVQVNGMSSMSDS